jgi:hypothetical protein
MALLIARRQRRTVADGYQPTSDEGNQTLLLQARNFTGITMDFI